MSGTIERSPERPRVTPLDRASAVRSAAIEYERGDRLLAQLDTKRWSAPTVNTGWDVRATVGHMVGMMEMVSGVAHLIRQQTVALRAARRAGAPVSIDELTALQVRLNAGLTVDELRAKYRSLTSAAVRGRGRVPEFLRRRRLPERQLINGMLEWWTIGYLVDVIVTRDPFMHRLDICAATGIEPEITADHEGRIVDGAVREWAGRHGRPYALTLTGPAGGHWSTGEGSATIEADALDFCRVISGRPAVSSELAPTGLLATGIPF